MHAGTTVTGKVGDRQYLSIGELDKKLRESGEGFAFAGWRIIRSYLKAEVDAAKLLLINIPLGPFAAEEYGAEYRDATRKGSDQESGGGVDRVEIGRTECKCGLGIEQVGPLRIPSRILKKGQDIHRLWGGEIIVSQKLSTLFLSHDLSGFALFPVLEETNQLTMPLPLINCAEGKEIILFAEKAGLGIWEWEFWQWLYEESQEPLLKRFLTRQGDPEMDPISGLGHTGNLAQLIVKSTPLEISKRSRFGETPFDIASGGYHRCGRGEIAGLCLLSELSVIGESWNGEDICNTQIYIGGRGGLFRPFQPLIVSAKVLEATRRDGLRGFDFEIVEIVTRSDSSSDSAHEIIV